MRTESTSWSAISALLSPRPASAAICASRRVNAVAIGLTRREAQVAALAGRGLSNAEIADQLVLSVRTVETHVYRAMQKRGVSDRHEL